MKYRVEIIVPVVVEADDPYEAIGLAADLRIDDPRFTEGYLRSFCDDGAASELEDQ